jgi:hypothetical protein
MRRFVVALVIAGLALMLIGCGGGDAPAEEGAAVDVPAATPAEPAEPAYVTDRSQVETGFPAPFPAFEETDTPDALQSKLDAKRPMLIFFYDSRHGVTKAQRAEVDAVMTEYRGLIDLITFDAAGAGEAAAEAAVYAGELGAGSAPYLIAVDDSGFITWRWRGFVDRDLIGREVERATQ